MILSGTMSQVVDLEKFCHGTPTVASAVNSLPTPVAC